MADASRRDTVTDEVSSSEAANATEAGLASHADLTRRASSQVFSAAWGDEWNPNPLSDLSV